MICNRAKLVTLAPEQIHVYGAGFNSVGFHKKLPGITKHNLSELGVRGYTFIPSLTLL